MKKPELMIVKSLDYNDICRYYQKEKWFDFDAIHVWMCDGANFRNGCYVMIDPDCDTDDYNECVVELARHIGVDFPEAIGDYGYVKLWVC